MENEDFIVGDGIYNIKEKRDGARVVVTLSLFCEGFLWFTYGFGG